MGRITDPALWKRLQGLTLATAGGEGAFTAKLARDEGWSAEDAARVAGEYRKFLYLAPLTDAPPAPPAPIDAAWRTHLLFTQSYRDGLETDVLGAPFHRDPGTVRDPGAQRAFWAAVRPAYEAEFGPVPPPDIWVDPRAPTMGGTIAGLMIVGIGGGLLSFILMFLLGWMFGIPVGGPVDTAFEKVFTAIFLLGWTAGFFSPLWAWLITCRQKRLKTTRRAKPGTIGISIGYGRS